MAADSGWKLEVGAGQPGGGGWGGTEQMLSRKGQAGSSRPVLPRKATAEVRTNFQLQRARGRGRGQEAKVLL